jgi:hypothetical protein
MEKLISRGSSFGLLEPLASSSSENSCEYLWFFGSLVIGFFAVYLAAEASAIGNGCGQPKSGRDQRKFSMRYKKSPLSQYPVSQRPWWCSFFCLLGWEFKPEFNTSVFLVQNTLFVISLNWYCFWTPCMEAQLSQIKQTALMMIDNNCSSTLKAVMSTYTF